MGWFRCTNGGEEIESHCICVGGSWQCVELCNLITMELPTHMTCIMQIMFSVSSFLYIERVCSYIYQTWFGDSDEQCAL